VADLNVGRHAVFVARARRACPSVGRVVWINTWTCTCQRLVLFPNHCKIFVCSELLLFMIMIILTQQKLQCTVLQLRKSQLVCNLLKFKTFVLNFDRLQTYW